MFQNANILRLIEGIPHAVILVDEDFRIRGMNRRAEALTGRSDEEAAGVDANMILRSNILTFESAFGGSFTDRQTLSQEANILDQNRKVLPVRITASPVEGQDDSLLGAMVVLEDLTLIVRAEDMATGVDEFDELMSLNPRMQEVGEQIPVFAGTDASVLIDGETGTGKGVVAEMIHRASKRSGFPFIKVNCGALPEQLLESELFGHVRGAFPGAERDKPGMFRLADRGTIFFTEIGDLPLTLQVKLLTVLDDGLFVPLGSTRKVAMNVRIIAATGKDLKSMVSDGLFREDLYYRLKVLQLHLPPLRERMEDIPMLIDHFVNLFSTGKHPPVIDPEALRLLKDYAYPGNIRELRNIIEHAITLCHGDTIRLEHIPDFLLPEHELGSFSKWRPYPKPVMSKAAAGEAGSTMKWDDVEKEMIIEALRKSRGRRSEAAKMLGWARSTLYRKLKYHDI